MEPNEEKLDTDNELTNKQGQIRIDDEFNIDVNSIVNSNKNRIQIIKREKKRKKRKIIKMKKIMKLKRIILILI